MQGEIKVSELNLAIKIENDIIEQSINDIIEHLEQIDKKIMILRKKINIDLEIINNKEAKILLNKTEANIIIGSIKLNQAIKEIKESIENPEKNVFGAMYEDEKNQDPLQRNDKKPDP